jgi:hypothetical protein
VADTVSFTARSWHDSPGGALLLHLVNVDGSAEIRLAEGLLLLRVTANEEGALYRCYVRHIATGREIVMQGGADLRAFVADCLLNTDGDVPSIAERWSGGVDRPARADHREI